MLLFHPISLYWVEYRSLGIYDVKGSVHVFFGKLHHRGERGEKGGGAKFQNQAHITFDIIIIYRPLWGQGEVQAQDHPAYQRIPFISGFLEARLKGNRVTDDICTSITK